MLVLVQEFPFLSKKNFIHFWFMVVCMKQEITENQIYIQWLQCLMASYMGKKTQDTQKRSVDFSIHLWYYSGGGGGGAIESIS